MDGYLPEYSRLYFSHIVFKFCRAFVVPDGRELPPLNSRPRLSTDYMCLVKRYTRAVRIGRDSQFDRPAMREWHFIAFFGNLNQINSRWSTPAGTHAHHPQFMQAPEKRSRRIENSKLAHNRLDSRIRHCCRPLTGSWVETSPNTAIFSTMHGGPTFPKS
jgi:hypothetical protein